MVVVGPTTGDTLPHFLVEAMAISLLRGIVRVRVGVMISIFVSPFALWPTELNAGSIALAFAISGLVSVFVGIYPVREMPFPEATEALPFE